MKILFINSSQYDYLQDIVYSGLVKVLGKRNIIDLPWNGKFHLPIKKYPKNLGYTAGGFPGTMFASKSRFDAVIVAACKPDAINAYLKFLPKIPANIPTVFIDGGDRSDLGGDLERLGHDSLWETVQESRPFDYVFKREYLLTANYPDIIKPLPFGWNSDRSKGITPSKQQKYDVAFWAGESHPLRTKVLDLISDKFDCNENGTGRGSDIYNFKRKGREYLKELGRCKINLSVRGGGFDTLRYWEVPAVGSMLLSEPADILIPNDFEHEKSAVFFKPDLTDLLDVVSYYLVHNQAREKIRTKGNERLYKYHTDIERAKTILEVLG